MEKKKVFPLKLTINLEITEEDIDDIMSTALEGGIYYWCARVKVEGEYLGEYASEQISRGGVLKLYDREEEAAYELTREKFMSGLGMYLENPIYETLYIGDGEYFVDEKYKVDVGNIDAIAADRIIQYALFGEIVYS